MAENRSAATVHRPVMKAECLAALQLEPTDSNGPLIVVDGTLGGGGHTKAIAARLGTRNSARLIAMDRDPAVIERHRNTLPGAVSPIDLTLHAGSYVELPAVLDDLGLEAVDRILLDLGLSSDQLMDRSRGFGFDAGGTLDLRFDPTTGPTAADYLRERPIDDIAAALRDFANEPRAVQVATALQQARVATTEELVDVVSRIVPASPGKHPATRTIQALRIAVNEELEHVRHALDEVFPSVTQPGARLAILTFHSIEDRIVKTAFRDAIDRSSGKPVWTLEPKKPILPRPAEVRANPRSRSAKLRVAIRN